MLLGLPLSFDYGLYQLLLTVLVGGTLVLEKGFRRSLAASSACSRARASPACRACRRCSACCSASAASATGNSPALRYLSNTGAALSATTIAGLRETFPAARIYSMYGLTECKRVSYLPPHLIDVKPASVGIAIPGTEVWVEDGDGNEAPPARWAS